MLYNSTPTVDNVLLIIVFVDKYITNLLILLIKIKFPFSTHDLFCNTYSSIFSYYYSWKPMCCYKDNDIDRVMSYWLALQSVISATNQSEHA